MWLVSFWIGNADPTPKVGDAAFVDKGGYETLSREGSMRGSFVLMGFVAGSYSAQWDIERRSLRANGQKLDRQVIEKFP
ncbi:hypothetical protein JCM25156A_30690 [Komagataeibacter kakiaceti JCM 25156]